MKRRAARKTAISSPEAATLPALLERSAALHGHLCPRQVLGVRSALLAGRVLGLEFPRTDKAVLALVETDGCYADGVSVASGCWLGRRTMRLLDYGKVATTFVEVRTGRAVRVSPQTDLRGRVRERRPEGQKRYQAYLEAYQRWPDDLLLDAVPVELQLDLAALISLPGKRVVCAECGEEIINGREVRRGERLLCRSCAGDTYFVGLADDRTRAANRNMLDSF